METVAKTQVDKDLRNGFNERVKIYDQAVFEELKMDCKTHSGHDHKHGESCGHPVVQHGDHIDYAHDSHLHHQHGEHVDEHTLEVSDTNTAKCTPDHKCSGHDAQHKHSAECGHLAVPHGDHVDYIVSGHLHSPCKDHCDDHGKVSAK